MNMEIDVLLISMVVMTATVNKMMAFDLFASALVISDRLLRRKLKMGLHSPA